MSEQERIWVKELTGIELGNIPGLIANGYAAYLSAVDDTQGWSISDVKPADNPFEGPSTVLFAEDAHRNLRVQPAEKVRVYVVGWPEP